LALVAAVVVVRVRQGNAQQTTISQLTNLIRMKEFQEAGRRAPLKERKTVIGARQFAVTQHAHRTAVP